MTPQEEIGHYFKVCGFRPDDSVSVVWRGRSGKLGWTHVLVSEAWRVIDGHRLVDTWISANPMFPPDNPAESRGAAEDVYAVRALWADLDVGPGKMASFAAARAVIDEVSELIGAQPVVLLASGHGLQPRWQVDFGEIARHAGAVEFLEGFGRLVQKIAEKHGGKADSVYDLPRIIRAPGTTNCKDGVKGIPVRVKFTGSTDVATMELVIAQFQRLAAPPETPTTPKAENVALERGDRYVLSVVNYIREELQGIKSWPVGKTDDRGRGWEKIQADAAFRLAELAKADWNSMTEEQAQAIFVDNAPIDSGWTVRDVIKKWKSQWPRAQAADPPAQVDDPLAPGYAGGDASPHAPAPAEDIWAGAEGEPREAGGDGDGVADPAAPASLTWRKYTWDDFGNAERTVQAYGHELRWSPAADRWYLYRNGAWRESKNGGEKAVQDMIRVLPDLEAGFYSKEEYRQGKKISSEYLDFIDWWKNQRAAAKVKAAATVIKNDGDLDVDPEAFDAQPMLLNALNGVIDLATGELLEHHPLMMLRRQIPVDYLPDAEAPTWEKFLDRVMPSPAMKEYLQRIVGYTITGDTGEQAVFMHYGPPASGKSAFLRIIEAVLGELSRVVPPTTLLTKKGESHPTDIMGLEGRRMLQVSETPEGARLDEALIKRLSGEETITARGMGQDFRDFRITGKVHLVTNHLPHISDDQATHRRLHLVKWGVTIPEGERDPRLADRIISEDLEGVLAWAVRGALEWRQTRLRRPVEAEMDRDEYIGSEDEFGQFIDEELIVGAESFTSSRDLYRRYTQYCDSLRMKPMSAVAFGRKLSARGIEPARTMNARGFKVALVSHGWIQDPLR